MIETSSHTPTRFLLAFGLASVLASVCAVALVGSTTSGQQLDTLGSGFASRIQDDAREAGSAVSRTLALTSAVALRDSDYSFLNDLARRITAGKSSILRIQVYDPSGALVADSDPAFKPGSRIQRKLERSSTAGMFQGKPIYEYLEPIEFGSSAGPGAVVVSYSLEPLEAMLAQVELDKAGALRQQWLRAAGVGALLLLLAGGAAVLLGRTLDRSSAGQTGADPR